MTGNSKIPNLKFLKQILGILEFLETKTAILAKFFKIHPKNKISKLELTKNSLKFAYMIFIGADLALGRTCAIMLACSQPASFKALRAAFASLLGKAKSNPPEVCAS